MWTKLIHRNEIWKNLNNEEQKLDLSECNCKTDQRGGEGTRGGDEGRGGGEKTGDFNVR